MSNYPGAYEKYQKMPLSELAEARTNYAPDTSSIAQLVYEEKMMQQQHEYNKQQIEIQNKLNKENIELQHKFNMALLEKQLRWVKISAAIAAIATLAAVVLGWSLSEMTASRRQSSSSAQSFQSQIAPLNAAPHSERKVDNIPKRTPSEK